MPGISVSDLGGITIISGGQTGADRAALEFALETGLPHGGWCPRGRLAEDGAIPPPYDLRETPSARYAERTEWNVRDSDATVVFTIAQRATGGTRLAIECARRLHKPVLHLHPNGASFQQAATDAAATKLLHFLAEHDVARLNVAGPRASQEPAISEFVRRVLVRAHSGS